MLKGKNSKYPIKNVDVNGEIVYSWMEVNRLRIQDRSWMTYSTNRVAKHQSSIAKTFEKLSGGDKIVRASLNASGLSISEKMRAQIHGLSRAQQNIQDGLSVLEVTDSGLQSVDKVLHRTRELAVQAANDTLTNEDRENVQLEIVELMENINKTAEDLEFNTQKILGEVRPLHIQVGANSDQSIAVDTVDVSTDKLGLQNASVKTQEDANELISKIDDAVSYVSDNLARIGANYNSLVAKHENAARVQESIQKSESIIRDPDMAREMMDLVKQQIVQKGNEMMIQNTNRNVNAVLDLFRVN